MRGIAALLVGGDVTEDKLIEACVVGGIGAHGGDGQEDEPREDPYREEDADDHPKEANEEIRIHAILCSDFPVV